MPVMLAHNSIGVLAHRYAIASCSVGDLGMRTIALIAQKGGVGKSTLAINLAVAAMQAGETVIGIDTDPQGTMAAWAAARAAQTPAIAHIDGANLGPLLAGARDRYSVAIIDTAGTDSPITHAAMSAADLCLVPLRPTRPDGIAVRPTVEALMVGRRRFGFVLSQCPSHTARAREMVAGLASIGLLAEPVICARADYQDGYAAGQGVTEYAADGKAADEIRKLWNWIATKVAAEAIAA
jgi:chromosome partitioning protein